MEQDTTRYYFQEEGISPLNNLLANFFTAVIPFPSSRIRLRTAYKSDSII